MTPEQSLRLTARRAALVSQSAAVEGDALVQLPRELFDEWFTAPLEALAAGPVGPIVPAGWVADNEAKCRSCGGPVTWATNEKSNARASFDPDGTSHFATCPDANAWLWRTRVR